MFTELVDIHYPSTTRQGFNIESRIRSALNYSEGHLLVRETETFLREHYNIRSFNGNQLLESWGMDNVSLGVKCIATFWWGNLSHHIATAYSPENMNRLQAIMPALQDDLAVISDETDFDHAIDLLRQVFVKLESGEYRMERVGVSFFTKIFQYYFASHPLRSREDFLPIICDVWLRKGVYVEMCEQEDDELRRRIFRNPESLHSVGRSYADNYIRFMKFFNRRVADLAADHPELSAFMLEGYIFSDEGRRYISDYLQQ